MCGCWSVGVCVQRVDLLVWQYQALGPLLVVMKLIQRSWVLDVALVRLLRRSWRLPALPVRPARD